VRNYGRGIGDVASRLSQVLREPEAADITEILKSNFLDPEAPGAIRVARFLTGRLDDNIQADVASSVARLIQSCNSQLRKARRAPRK